MKHLKQLLLLSIAILLWSCYPEGAEDIEELDVVYTNYDASFEFEQQSTFAIPDSVVIIANEVENGDNEFVDPVYGDVIIDQITQNLVDHGWTEVSEDDDPDVIILPSAMSTTNLYYYYDWGYWDWYYPGFRPSLGWYYPGFYYPTTTTGYRTGTIFIQMTYPEGTAPNNNVPVVWNATINGLLEGSEESLNERFRTTIDQAFDQSPFLEL